MDVQEKTQAAAMGMPRPTTIFIPDNIPTKSSSPLSPESVLVGFHDCSPPSPVDKPLVSDSMLSSPTSRALPKSPQYPPPRPPGHRRIKKNTNLIRSLSEGSATPLAVKYDRLFKKSKPLQRSFSNSGLSEIHLKKMGLGTDAGAASALSPSSAPLPSMSRRSRLGAWMSSLFEAEAQEPGHSKLPGAGLKVQVEEVNVNLQKLPKKNSPGALHIGRLIFVMLLINLLFVAAVIVGMRNGAEKLGSMIERSEKKTKAASEPPVSLLSDASSATGRESVSLLPSDASNTPPQEEKAKAEVSPSSPSLSSSSASTSSSSTTSSSPSQEEQQQGDEKLQKEQQPLISGANSQTSASARKLLSKKTTSSVAARKEEGESKTAKILKALHVVGGKSLKSGTGSNSARRKKAAEEWVRVWQQYWVDKADVRAGRGIQLVDSTALVAQAEGEDFTGESATTSDVRRLSSKRIRGV